MTKAILGFTIVVCHLWSLLIAVIFHFTNLGLFDDTILFWFSAVMAPSILVGLFHWGHRIRFLFYAAMLFWLMNVFQGDSDYIFLIAIGYPIAIYYEFMSRRYSSAESVEEDLTTEMGVENTTDETAEQVKD